MDPPGAIRDAVVRFIESRDPPIMENRDKAFSEVALLLEDIVRERVDDGKSQRPLTVSTRGTSDGQRTLNISGGFWTLGMRAQGLAGARMVPMDARLSVGSRPIVDVAWVRRVTDARH